MLDPATAIGVASAVVAFIDFSIELVSGTCEVYRSLSGATAANAHVDVIVRDLESASTTLFVQQQQQQQNSGGGGALSGQEQAIFDLSRQCHQKCVELIAVLQGLKVRDKTKWASFRTVWLSRRRKEDVARMQADLRDYRSAILLRLSEMQLESNAQQHTKLDSLLRQVEQQIKTEEEISAAVCSRIKEQLYFGSMYVRDKSISDPEYGTFDWVVDADDDYSAVAGDDVPDDVVEKQQAAREDLRTQYLSWLEGNSDSDGDAGGGGSSSSVLHVSGKAGSGKSTLMRHLFHHARTREALLEWAGQRQLVFASFYFWAVSGDGLQTSLEGLYRSILHEVLLQCPDLAPDLFPDQWQAIRSSLPRGDDRNTAGSSDAVLFRGKAVDDAFQRLVGCSAVDGSRYCFCLFIDGLDEYREVATNGAGGSSSSNSSTWYGFKSLVKQVLRWSEADNVKICTSARPYPEFLEPLARRRATVLHLEAVNMCDIYRYTKQTFEKDDDFDEFRDAYLGFVAAITSRAQGVFLWALLTVRMLITSLARGDGAAVQLQKLDGVPEELDGLYGMLLGQIEKSDRERASQILLLAVNNPQRRTGLPALWVSWLDDLQDADFPPTTVRVDDYDDAEVRRRIDRGRRLLVSLTRGILEFSSTGVGSGYLRPPNVGLFFHRTAYDYLCERQASGELASQNLDFAGDDVYGRLFLAGFVYIHRDPDTAAERIQSKRHPQYLATTARLADATALYLAARRRTKLDPPAVVKLTMPMSYRCSLDGCFPSGSADETDDELGTQRRLPGVTSLGYLLLHRLERNFYSGNERRWPVQNALLPFRSRLSDADLFAQLFHYCCHADFDTVANILWRQRDDVRFLQYLGTPSLASPPSPPWMFLFACAATSGIYCGLKPPSLDGMLPALLFLMDEIAPPDAMHRGTVTLVGSAAATVSLGQVRELLRTDNVRGLCELGLERSGGEVAFTAIEYGAYKITSSFRWIVTCV